MMGYKDVPNVGHAGAVGMLPGHCGRPIGRCVDRLFWGWFIPAATGGIGYPRLQFGAAGSAQR